MLVKLRQQLDEMLAGVGSSVDGVLEAAALKAAAACGPGQMVVMPETKVATKAADMVRWHARAGACVGARAPVGVCACVNVAVCAACAVAAGQGGG